jgi:hypothetical protein
VTKESPITALLLLQLHSRHAMKTRMVKKLEATEEPQLAALHFGATSIQPVRVKAALHDVTLE